MLLLDIEKSQICLAKKRRGFGVGKLNGYGGKVDGEETIEDAAIRELQEETSGSGNPNGVRADKKNLNKVAVFEFEFPHEDFDGQQVHVFLVEYWEGDPVESEEMSPEWHSTDNIPFDKMWADDEIWLPKVLEGERLFGTFVFAKDGSVEKYELKPF